MGLRVVGAGLGRTGTSSLKRALEHLLGAPCYHMSEVFPRPDHLAVWRRAADGEPADLDAVFSGFVATVDWPSAAYWEQLAAANPDAVVLLSRRDPEAWWRSAEATILATFRDPPTEERRPFFEMVTAMFRRTFTPDFLDRDAAIAAFVRHEEHVLASAPRERLVEWRAEQGWGPLCDALRVPIPDQPFPHENTTEAFLSRR